MTDEKSYENILYYDVVYQTPYGANPLYIIFDKVYGYIRKYDKTRYLALFCFNEKYEIIFDRINYLIIFKSDISDVNFHKYREIKINGDDNLPSENTLATHNVVILLKFFLIKIIIIITIKY